MELQTLFAFYFAALLFAGGESAIFTIKNNCRDTIWPAAVTTSGSQPSTTGFELAPQATNTITIPAPWSGKIWARTFCTTTCITGDCGQGGGPCNGAGGAEPVTQVEFTLNGDGGKDFYYISHVIGFNLPVSIVPENSTCPTTSCAEDLNDECSELQEVRGPDGATVVGCYGACPAAYKREDCCAGVGSPVNIFSSYFYEKCPEADTFFCKKYKPIRIFTCPTGPNYQITFCPCKVNMN